MRRSVIAETLAGIFFLLAIFGLVHQKLVTASSWFSWTQFWHHEPLIVLCLGVAVALIVGKYASVLKAVKRTHNKRGRKIKTRNYKKQLVP